MIFYYWKLSLFSASKGKLNYIFKCNLLIVALRHNEYPNWDGSYSTSVRQAVCWTPDVPIVRRIMTRVGRAVQVLTERKYHDLLIKVTVEDPDKKGLLTLTPNSSFEVPKIVHFRFV